MTFHVFLFILTMAFYVICSLFVSHNSYLPLDKNHLLKLTSMFMKYVHFTRILFNSGNLITVQYIECYENNSL